MKEGEFMTRICAVSDDRILSVSADSLFVNTITKEKTVNNKKLISNENMIVGGLGSLELITNRGTIQIMEVIHRHLHLSKNSIQTIKDIEDEIMQIVLYFHYSSPIQLVFFWKEEKHFYMYSSQIKYSIEFGQLEPFRPFGQISEKNKFKFMFHHYILDAGEGAKNNLDVHYLSHSEHSPSFMSYNIVQEAINDKTLETVGGKVKTITLEI